MDVQGAELMVLKGAGELIEHIKLIWLEVESVELYKDQPVRSDVEAFMRDNGFQLLKDTVGRVSGDQLYISNDFYQNSGIGQVDFTISCDSDNTHPFYRVRFHISSSSGLDYCYALVEKCT